MSIRFVPLEQFVCIFEQEHERGNSKTHVCLIYATVK